MARSIQLLRWLRKCDHRPFQGQTSFVETEVCFYFLHYACLHTKLNFVLSDWWWWWWFWCVWCRAFVYEGFLTELECDHLISIAKSELKRSAVADNLSGESKLSEVRTSSGMFIPKNKAGSPFSLFITFYIEFLCASARSNANLITPWCLWGCNVTTKEQFFNVFNLILFYFVLY